MADEKVKQKCCSTAYQVLKKNFPKLLDIPPEEVCDFLFSDDVITMEGLDNATNKLLSNKERTRKMIMALQKAVQSDHRHFERFCDNLEQNYTSPGLSELGAKLNGKSENCIKKHKPLTLDYCSVYLYQSCFLLPAAYRSALESTEEDAGPGGKQ